MARRPKTKARTQAIPVHGTTQNAAWESIKQFNKLLPTLTSFARMMTGNPKVTVRATRDTSSTDGTNIYIRPPIELGMYLAHEAHLCYKRLPNGEQSCSACSAREMVLWILYHEVAHISEKSTDRPYSAEVDRVVELIREWHPKDACDHADQLILQAHTAVDTLNLVGVHNPFLPAIIKPLEDVRVDTRIPQLRPGLRIVQQVRVRNVMEEGVKRADGTVAHWREAPVSAQVFTALLLIGLEIEIEPDWFVSEVYPYLEDRGIGGLVSLAHRSRYAGSVHEIFDLTIKLWYRAQELGLFTVPKCEVAPTPESEPESQPEDDKESDGQPQEGESSDGTGDSSNQSTGDSSESDGADDATQSSQEDKSDDGDPGTGSADSSGGDGADFGGQAENTDDCSRGDDKQGSANDDSSNSTEVPDEPENGNSGSDDTGEEFQDESSLNADQDHSAGNTEEPAGEDDSSGLADLPAGDDDAGSTDPSSSGDDDNADSSTEDDVSDGRSSSEDEDSGDVDNASGAGHEDSPESDEADTEQIPDEGTPPAPKGEAVWDEPVAPEPRTAEDIRSEADILQQLMNQFDPGSSVELVTDPLGVDKDEYQLSREESAIARAITQSEVFDTTSHNMRGLQTITYPYAPFSWGVGFSYPPSDFEPAESIIANALLKARVAFAENHMIREHRNLKSGRVNSRVLGKRAPLEDGRLFFKRQLPGKRDYFVLIGVDVSGSTGRHSRLERIKRAVFAKANLLSRLGIKFAIYAHTGGANAENIYDWEAPDHEVWMLEVKGATEPWNVTTKQRLAALNAVAENYDGHTLEFYRKVLDGRRETDRIIIYYTDGVMPAANPEEELLILEREIATCKKKKYHLLAAGIGTSSPADHGFDTVQIDSDHDLIKVVNLLQRKLTS